MKIRVAAQLERLLSKSLSWRKRELTAIKFAVDTAPRLEQNALLRAATTLLYAHWEGFVKEASVNYVKLVANQNLTLGELRPSFIAVSVRPEIIASGKTLRAPVHRTLVDRLTTGMALPANMGWKNIIRTRSNLKAEVFKEIIQTLDLDFAPFELKGKPVIDKLVNARNGVAHGQGIPIEHDEYATLHSEVIDLLDKFKEQLETAASAKRYRR